MPFVGKSVPGVWVPHFSPFLREVGLSPYCAAFTSFQISLYFARRGTFCQK